jgi:hypothetical protein
MGLASADGMIQDLRHAARSLRHAGALPIVAMLTLAIGIGGVAAMFTVLNRVVLDPLPFPDSDRLVLIWGSKPHEGQPELPFSQPDFEDLRAQARALEAIGGWARDRCQSAGGADRDGVRPGRTLHGTAALELLAPGGLCRGGAGAGHDRRVRSARARRRPAHAGARNTVGTRRPAARSAGP